jgi:site-specific DNA-cytosine methylase
VTPWTEAAPTVTSGAKIHAGAFQVADPRIHCRPRAGAYRVLRWDEAAATITGSLAVDNGAAAIADPRLRPDRQPPFTPLIIAADNTWHRPLTTLELGVLQSFPAMIDGKPLKLAGDSHTRWREAIGNAVPPLAALHIAAQLLRALLISALGAFEMSNNPVWVAPHRMAYVA